MLSSLALVALLCLNAVWSEELPVEVTAYWLSIGLPMINSTPPVDFQTKAQTIFQWIGSGIEVTTAKGFDVLAGYPGTIRALHQLWQEQQHPREKDFTAFVDSNGSQLAPSLFSSHRPRVQKIALSHLNSAFSAEDEVIAKEAFGERWSRKQKESVFTSVVASHVIFPEAAQHLYGMSIQQILDNPNAAVHHRFMYTRCIFRNHVVTLFYPADYQIDVTTACAFVICTFELFDKSRVRKSNTTIYIYGSYSKKTFSGKLGAPLDRSQINSANTDEHGQIFVFRGAEEIVKVIVHEVLHNIQAIQHDFVDYSAVAQSMSRLISLPSETAVVEAVVESIAELVCMAVKPDRSFQVTLENQLRFSLVQTAKILHRFGFASWKKFSRPCPSAKCIKQDRTFAAEYFIVKMLILFDSRIYTQLLAAPNKETRTDLLTRSILHTIGNHQLSETTNHILKSIENLDGWPDLKATARMYLYGQ